MSFSFLVTDTTKKKLLINLSTRGGGGGVVWPMQYADWSATDISEKSAKSRYTFVYLVDYICDSLGLLSGFASADYYQKIWRSTHKWSSWIHFHSVNQMEIINILCYEESPGCPLLYISYLDTFMRVSNSKKYMSKLLFYYSKLSCEKTFYWILTVEKIKRIISGGLFKIWRVILVIKWQYIYMHNTKKLPLPLLIVRKLFGHLALYIIILSFFFSPVWLHFLNLQIECRVLHFVPYNMELVSFCSM